MYVGHRLNRVTVERHRGITMADSGLWGMVEPVYYYLFLWRNGPQWARAFSLTSFLDRTQRRTTVGRTPLDE